MTDTDAFPTLWLWRDYVIDNDGMVYNKLRNPEGRQAADLIAAQREALEWYAEKVAGCRKITSEGNDARNALDRDGGQIARAALGGHDE